MVGPLLTNNNSGPYSLGAKAFRHFDAEGEGRHLSQICRERLNYSPTLPEVLRGEHRAALAMARQLGGAERGDCGPIVCQPPLLLACWE